MHPPLLRPHPRCQDVVDKLMMCHEEHSVSKYWGACNEHKVALDQCFRLEKEETRKKNADAARERRRRFEASRVAQANP